MPEVLASCEYCGTPVPGVETNGPGGNGNMNAPKQPELPAWLETLRGSERPSSSPSGASPYAAADFVDENALPSWMRPDIPDNAQSGKFPAVRPAARPAPNTEGNNASFASMSAHSLIDEQSLPSWMQEAHAAPAVGQENIVAASLVQPEAVPDWMKAMPQPPASPQTPSAPVYQPATPPFAGPVQSSPFPPSAIPPQGLTGSDLIDPQALPSWMSAQSHNAPGAANGAQGQMGMSAGSLIDKSALPSWLREGSQQAQPNSAPALPSAFAPSPAQAAQPAPGNSISASSFIDVDALPDWLRPTEDQRNGRGMEQVRPGLSGPGVPGRAENMQNMRVPSRPRGDMPSIEESAVAANVFASMLGVASTTPNMPGQQQGPQGGAMPPRQQSPQPASFPQPMAPPPSQGNGSGSNWNMSGLPEGLNAANLPPLAPPPGYTIPTPQSIGVAQNAMPPRSPQPSPGYAQSGMADGQQKNGTKKRGFLETILNWFSR